jgi:hypothetical protein
MGLFVAGGQVPDEAAQEDFRSDPPAGGPLEDGLTEDFAASIAYGIDNAADQLAAAMHSTPQAASDAVIAAIEWDQAAAAEPWQIDVTRSLEDTTRMGNQLGKAIRDDMLGKAVRLEVGLDALREETLDRRGPGYPADYPTDPVDGTELDPVDRLPIGQVCDYCGGPHAQADCAEYDADAEVNTDELADDDGDQLAADLLGADYLRERFAPGWQEQAAASLDKAVADQLDATRLVLGSPPPPPAPRLEEHLTHTVGEELPADATVLDPLPMPPELAATTRGIPARVLNWASRHDPASLEYGVRQRLRAPAPLMDRLWPHGPILDQGTAPPLSLHDASGCTGHAGVNAANVMTLAAHTGPADVRPPLDSGDAMRLYEAAQLLDEVPGEAYPGTSILALMKAGQAAGYWGAYLWAFGTRDIAQAILQVGPVVIGIPWLSGMTDTSPEGIVTVAGSDQGGHALCLFAIKMVVGGRPGPWFGALQTWGEGVGDHGVIWFHHKDLARLLHGLGEAAIPVAAL